MTCPLNFIKSTNSIQIFDKGTDTQTGRWSHKPTFFFRKESTLITISINNNIKIVIVLLAGILATGIPFVC
jgi:hypothetical protein